MNGFKELIETFQNALLPEYGNMGLNGYVDYIMKYAYMLAAIFMILLVGVRVVTYFANPSKDMDPYILVKPLLIIAALVLYQPLVKLLLYSPTNIINDVTEEAAIYVTNAGDNEKFQKLFLNNMTFIQDSSTDEDGSSGSGIYDILQANPILELLHFLIYLVAGTVAAYIMIRQLILKALYFVLGVLVLPFSLIPGNEEILKRWFFGFLATLLWIPILRILQTIMILIYTVDTKGMIQPLISVALQIVMIIFILQVPKYANFLVSGSGDSDTNGWLFFVGREFYYRKLGGMGGGSGDRQRRR